MSEGGNRVATSMAVEIKTTGERTSTLPRRARSNLRTKQSDVDRHQDLKAQQKVTRRQNSNRHGNTRENRETSKHPLSQGQCVPGSDQGTVSLNTVGTVPICL